MKLTQLQTAARIAFASEYAFYQKTHQAHWNVEGPNFFEYHKLFETIYSEVYGIIDDFAEKIRALQAYVPGSASRISILSVNDEELGQPSSAESVVELLEDSLKLTQLFKLVYDLAESESEYGFSNFLAERIDAHRKHEWFLRSYMRDVQ